MDESNAIEIETSGFSPEHALRGYALIYIASEFFDERERLSASIALAKKRCVFLPFQNLRTSMRFL